MHDHNHDHHGETAASPDIWQPPSYEEVEEKTRQYVLGTYTRYPVAFYFGQGAMLYDLEQKEYIDFLSGISVTNLGHGEADIVEAIREQAERIIHSSNLYYNAEQAQFAEALILHTFPGKVFFSNSGAEANEAAFKLMRRHGQLNKSGAQRIIATEHSFHGRTAAAMAMTGNTKIRTGFGNLLPEISHIPADLTTLERTFEQYGGEICGMIFEIVQGEGGINPLPVDFVRRARELCTQYNAVLVVDEIQTGLGRTGKLFAFEHYDILPDAMSLAKSLGGGLPLGALIISEEHAATLEAGMHGSTFGGNHLACRVGFEILRILVGREIVDNVNAMSEYFFQRLKMMQEKIPAIQDVRGIGLMIGIELDRPSRPVAARCLEKGLIVNATADTVIRLLPPLNLDLDTAARGLDLLEEAFLELKS
ncbi:acetylornithine/succinylornithine family transaminase [Leptonema illini]|uniref:Acetylornithine aminotransferase apoenzyme n=1 Tax=Leptonema illini DSM 21528 TaxID=929563 RepID=H2CIR1_9LEPT|nr:acetylornithine/succinylornithine family transaminase [Leptonema illini]EHQ07077.1 acetylornithine aminotransferase apoenzyme [Leptonema illini DSM 21528]